MTFNREKNFTLSARTGAESPPFAPGGVRGVILRLRQYQFLFEELVKRDFKKKYKRSVLGMGWSVLNPLLMLLVMWVVFANLFGRGIVKPEILILDEVLSVGDGAFRKKSEAKMMEILKGGTTTIFVSHSIGQIKRLCNKVLWLEKCEQKAFSADVEAVCDEYEGLDKLERRL